MPPESLKTITYSKTLSMWKMDSRILVVYYPCVVTMLVLLKQSWAEKKPSHSHVYVYIGVYKAHITCSTIVIAEFVFDALHNNLQVHFHMDCVQKIVYNSQDSMSCICTSPCSFWLMSCKWCLWPTPWHQHIIGMLSGSFLLSPSCLFLNTHTHTTINKVFINCKLLSGKTVLSMHTPTQALSLIHIWRCRRWP